jgi:hypothetical protein
MLFLIFFITCVFVFSAFLGSLPVGIANSFIGYVFYQVNFLLQYLFFFFVGFFIVIFFFVRQQKFDKEDLFHTNYFLSFIQASMLFLACGFFAFVVLLCIAWVELNSFAVLTNVNPAFLGITTHPTTIYKTLQKNNRTPQIIASDKVPQKEVVSIAQAITGTTNFYGNTMLSAIPDFLILPIKKLPSSLMLIDNTLIVTDINAKDIQTISPLIGYEFVQHYFSTRPIKSYPTTSVMTDKEFIAYRQKDSQEKLAKVEVEIQKMKDSISTVSANIQDDNDAITANDTSQKDALKKQSTQYNACLSEGDYISGKFNPKNTKEDCQKILDLWASTLETLGNDETSLHAQLEKDRQLLKDYQYYETFFTAQKTLLSVASSNIPSEYGVFVPPDSLKIIINSKSSHSIGDYYETLVHEYLHYASYVPGKRLESGFFEEGLTEYFARQTIKDTLQIDTNIGYPVAVKIIQAITNRIAEVDLADVYFTKNQLALEKILNLTYGDNFYKDNITLFETLMYTSDPQQALQLANTIMKKIGGQPLTEKDLYSSKSKL